MAPIPNICAMELIAGQPAGIVTSGSSALPPDSVSGMTG